MTDLTREASVERSLRREVLRLGGRCDKLAPTTEGLPDRLVMLPGGFLALVEVKRPKAGRLSPGQLAYHAHAERLGSPVYVVRNAEDVQNLIREAQSGLPK